jgi:hypothetical protein
VIITGSPSFASSAQNQENKKEETKVELTEVQKLKAENFNLKVKIAQLNATLQDRENKLLSVELSNEQTKLLEEFRKQLKANEKQEFDWSTLSFKPLTITDKK